MNLSMLTQKSLSLFGALGGWRTVAESVASRALFLIAFIMTEKVVMSALMAIGGVLAFAMMRPRSARKSWQSAMAVVVVAVSALIAGSTGRAIDFYLTTLLLQAAGGAVFLVSVLVRWPMIGLVVGTVRGESSAWRRDRRQRSRYYLCTAAFLAKFTIATAVLVPLYTSGAVIPLGVAATLLGGAPAAGVCVYLCWRILREPGTGTRRALTSTGHPRP
jgi:hypothetical protein